jgi:hypothetical protein
MPMQKTGTVDQPRSEAAAKGNLELFEQEMRGRRQDDFRNMLIWGDNKLVMASLLKDFKGKIDLIYMFCARRTSSCATSIDDGADVDPPEVGRPRSLAIRRVNW